jgi:hypothetical protein
MGRAGRKALGFQPFFVRAILLFPLSFVNSELKPEAEDDKTVVMF